MSFIIKYFTFLLLSNQATLFIALDDSKIKYIPKSKLFINFSFKCMHICLPEYCICTCVYVHVVYSAQEIIDFIHGLQTLNWRLLDGPQIIPNNPIGARWSHTKAESSVHVAHQDSGMMSELRSPWRHVRFNLLRCKSTECKEQMQEEPFSLLRGNAASAHPKGTIRLPQNEVCVVGGGGGVDMLNIPCFVGENERYIPQGETWEVV